MGKPPKEDDGIVFFTVVFELVERDGVHHHRRKSLKTTEGSLKVPGDTDSLDSRSFTSSRSSVVSSDVSDEEEEEFFDGVEDNP